MGVGVGAGVSQLVGGCAQTHKAAKDWYLQYGYSWSGCPARIELEGPINLSFSTLAAMTLDGMIGTMPCAQRESNVTECRSNRRCVS